MISGLVRPRKPYFIGKSATGTRFVGDYQDFDTFLWVTDPKHNACLVQALKDAYQRTPGTILDVGANVGLVSLMLSRHIEGRDEVIAFEPAPPAARACCHLGSQFPLAVRLVPMAVSNFDGEIELFVTQGHSGASTPHPPRGSNGSDWVPVKVKSRSLDSLRREGLFGKVGIIKIDVEGFVTPGHRRCKEHNSLGPPFALL